MSYYYLVDNKIDTIVDSEWLPILTVHPSLVLSDARPSPGPQRGGEAVVASASRNPSGPHITLTAGSSVPTAHALCILETVLGFFFGHRDIAVSVPVPPKAGRDRSRPLGRAQGTKGDPSGA